MDPLQSANPSYVTVTQSRHFTPRLNFSYLKPAKRKSKGAHPNFCLMPIFTSWGHQSQFIVVQELVINPVISSSTILPTNYMKSVWMILASYLVNNFELHNFSPDFSLTMISLNKANCHPWAMVSLQAVMERV
jgi:hypothetical protein